MIGGWDHSSDRERSPEPIDYEAAVRELLRKRRRRKLVDWLGRLPDPRPTSPGQVVLVGLLLVVVGWLVPVAHVALLIGVALLLFGFGSGLIQPRGRSVVWRNRSIELPPQKRPTDRLYYLVYRRAK